MLVLFLAIFPTETLPGKFYRDDLIGQGGLIRFLYFDVIVRKTTDIISYIMIFEQNRTNLSFKPMVKLT